MGCYNNAGQVCCANGRILVQEKVHEPLVRKVVEESQRWHLGDPRKEETDIGSMNNEPTVSKVERHLAEGTGKGAQILAGGHRAMNLPTSLYFPATVVDGVTTDMLLGNSETSSGSARSWSSEPWTKPRRWSSPTGTGSAWRSHGEHQARVHPRPRAQGGKIVTDDSGPVLGLQPPLAAGPWSRFGRVAGKWTIEAFTELKTVIQRRREPEPHRVKRSSDAPVEVRGSG